MTTLDPLRRKVDERQRFFGAGGIPLKAWGGLLLNYYVFAGLARSAKDSIRDAFDA
jgi:hypothetical protein